MAKKFAIITHAAHKMDAGKIYAYEPYVREMNLWLKHVDETRIVAPLLDEKIIKTDSFYTFKNIELSKIPSFNILSIGNTIASIFKIPVILISIFKACYWADHIHIRCPGNVGLLACFVQILFPKKSKTIKYAGNWDPKSKQPWSYRLQKKIVSNTFLTKNCKVLVYGDWKERSKNIVPFFTASYKEHEIINVDKKALTPFIKIIFVGTLSNNKRPLLIVETVKSLIEQGHRVQLNLYGDGPEFNTIDTYIKDHTLGEYIKLHGNQTKEVIKQAFISSHFLFFMSMSEGWPKVVTEAMFWGCLPITSNVSCLPYILDNNTRGTITENAIESISSVFNKYLNNEDFYYSSVQKAKEWSHGFTLDKFEKEIVKFL